MRQPASWSGNDPLTERVISVFFSVYNRLGYGFAESVYARGMEVRLVGAGLQVAREAALEVRMDDEVLGEFKADMIVEDTLILEFKAGPKLLEADFLQTMNYLRAADLPVGLLLHFGPSPTVRRIHRPRAH